MAASCRAADGSVGIALARWSLRVFILLLLLAGPVSLATERDPGETRERGPEGTQALFDGRSYDAFYGEGLRFDVVRKGKRIGTHSIDFQAFEEELEVRVVTRIAVSFLLFFEYQFNYDAVARWDIQGLRSVTMYGVDGSDKSRVEARRLDTGGYHVMATTDEGDLEYETPAPLFPNHHWNVAVLEAGKVLDTLTGDLQRFRIRHAGRELLSIGGSEVAADHYHYEGTVRQEVWYDEQGRLLRLRFPSRDGVPVEFVCTLCPPLPYEGGPLPGTR